MLYPVRALFRRGWTAVIAALFLGLTVSLLPGLVTREELPGVCSCPNHVENLVRVVSRHKREVTQTPLIPNTLGASQKNTSRLKKQDAFLDELQTDLPRSGVSKTGGTDNARPENAKFRNGTVRSGKDLPKNKTAASEKKTSSISSVVKSVTSEGSGGQRAQTSVGNKRAGSVTTVPPCQQSHEQPSLSPVEYVMHAFLNSSLSKLERRNMQLLAQMEWIGDDVVVQRNLSTFLANKTSTRRPVPKLLHGQENGCGRDPPFLLVFVPSVANHSATRQVIRDTWAGPAYGQPWPQGINVTQKVKVMFVFGRSNASESVLLSAEQAKYGDIVRADFVDSYQNLTIKMLVALHWSAYFCPGARFFIKVDEDTFVNLPVLLDVLTMVSSRHSHFMMGHRNYIPIVMRSGKWKVNKTDYPFRHFPAYVHGHSYVISGDVIKNITDTAPYVPVVPIEDAYVTGIMAAALNIPRIHAAIFAEASRHVNPCEVVLGRYVSQTRFSVRGMEGLWKSAGSGRCTAWM